MTSQLPKIEKCIGRFATNAFWILRTGGCGHMDVANLIHKSSTRICVNFIQNGDNMSGGHGGTNRTREDEEESDTPAPPDGGWGWMVVFGSFMIHVITDGVTYSFGIFYDEFLEYFKEGKGPTSWILSILVGVTLCSGPMSGYFVNRWGCRAVTIAGSILASGCLVISFWAQNVITLCFTIGIGTGTGFGLIYLPAIVSVTAYFEKKRSLATGIAVCGSGFGY
nr:unnamed protein product [Callosobruchus chinensis]